MTLGSFTVNGQRIDVENTWSDIDGVVYQLIDGASGRQIAVTTYRGLDVAEGAGLDKTALQDGLRTVLQRSKRG